MKVKTTIVALAFLAGYAANDLVGAVSGGMFQPASAYSDDLEYQVQEIIESCSVYIYDISDGAGFGEISC